MNATARHAAPRRRWRDLVGALSVSRRGRHRRLTPTAQQMLESSDLNALLAMIGGAR